MTESILLLIVGLIAGTFGSIVGLGGGIIIVPALLYLKELYPAFDSITPSIAVGTSLLLIVLTSLASTLSYAKLRRVDFTSGILFFIGSGPGAILGAYIGKLFTIGFFFISFGVIMTMVALLILCKGTRHATPLNWSQEKITKADQGKLNRCDYPLNLAIFLSFIVGMLSGMFGIGGGALLVPVMILLFQFPPLIAIATSMFTIFLSAVCGSITHLWQAHIDWYIFVLLAPGAWLGGRLGVHIAKRLQGKVILILLQAAILWIGIKMILTGVQQL